MSNKKNLKLKYPLLASLILTSTLASASVSIQNDFTKVGVSNVGTFGSIGTTPPGILYDPTGKGNFDPATDYLTPGQPWQMFAVKTKETGHQVNINTTPSTWETPREDIKTIEAVKVEAGQAAASWTGKYEDYYTVKNRYSIDKTQKGISVQSVIHALKDLHEVRFATAVDPDPDAGDKHSFNTINERGSEKFGPDDWIGSAGAVTGRPLGIYSTSAYLHRTRISEQIHSSWHTDPDYYLEENSPLKNEGDYGIGMGFLVGDLAAGKSATIDYQYLMGDSVEEIKPKVMTNIDTKADHYLGTELGVSVNPIFEGGTLQLNQDKNARDVFYASNFAVMKQGGTIDANGRDSEFSGVFADYTDENGVQIGGALTITDHSEGSKGSVVFEKANTYTGLTVIADGKLALAKEGDIGKSAGVDMRGTESVFDVSALTHPGTVIQDLTGVSGARIVTGTTVLSAGTGNNTEYAGTFEGSGGFAKQGTGTMVLTGKSPAFAGNNVVREGVLQVDGELSGQSLHVAGGATLSGRGAVGGQVTALSGSTITPAGSSMGTLTLTGDYVGEATSKIVLQTALGGDGSATDLLKINGSSAGSALVHVENMKGKGALTKNGIKVIDVEGKSEAKFALDQGVLRAGAYEYRLYQNSPANPADGDWYLRSSYQPVVATYITTLAANTATGQLVLGDLHQRLGVPYDMQRSQAMLWVRALGDDANHQGKSDFQYDQTSKGFQLGANVFKTAQGDNQHLVGVTSQYVHGSIKSRDQQRADAGLAARTGSAKNETYGMGLTYTLVHNNDSYLDIVGQVNRVENKITDSNQQQSRLRGWQYSLSAEVGKAFAVAPSLTIEPQAQLSYVVTNYDAAKDGSSRIDAGTTKAVQLRLGAQVNKTFLVKDRPVQAYVLANYRHDFAHDNSVQFTALSDGQRDEIIDAQGKDSIELGVGVQGKFSETTYVYGDIRQQRSFSSGFNNRINLGVKLLF